MAAAWDLGEDLFRGGGCSAATMVDLWVMVAEADDAELVLERWRTGRASDLDLYLVVSDAMDQAARRGLWGVLREAPESHDVQTAMVDAFRELWAKDPATIDRLVSFAATIADRRGRDRGRVIIREGKKMRELTDKLGGQLELDDLDDQAATARGRNPSAQADRAGRARRCPARCGCSYRALTRKSSQRTTS